MGKKEVQIVVSAKDQATQVFKRLGISVEGSTKQLDKFAKTTRRAGRYLTTFVTGPLVLAAGRFVKAASDFTETSSKFDAAFGDMADSSRAFANQLADDMYRSRAQMQNFMADTMAMTKPVLENAKAADTLSRAVTALAVDLASFFNTADDDALQALHSGLVGMTRPLRSYGVVLLESTIQQEAYRIGLKKTNQEMSEGEKMALRFIQILRQTQDAQGDAILTGASFENQLRALKSSFADLSVEIGQELMPYALAVVKWARDMIDAFRSLDPETKKTIIQFAGIVSIAGPLTLALSAIVRGIVLTGKALWAVAEFAMNHPYIFLATVAAALAMQIDAVQEAVESLMRSLGMGVVYDTIDAFEELGKAASSIVFDPDAAGADAMKQYYKKWAEEIQQMLKDGILSGGTSAAEELNKKLFDALMGSGLVGGAKIKGLVYDPWYAKQDEWKELFMLDEDDKQQAINSIKQFTVERDQAIRDLIYGDIQGKYSGKYGKEIRYLDSLKADLKAAQDLYVALKQIGYRGSLLEELERVIGIQDNPDSLPHLIKQTSTFSVNWAAGFQDALEATRDWSKNAQQLAKDTAQAMQQSFSDFFFDAFTLQLKSLADYLNSFYRSVARSLANYLGASFMNLIFPGTIPGRAAGGPVSSGQPYVVGERGPELFIPNNSGRIVPNGGLGTPDVTVNLINQGGQPIKQVERKTSFDGRRVIVDLIYSAAADNVGGFGDFLKGHA